MAIQFPKEAVLPNSAVCLHAGGAVYQRDEGERLLGERHPKVEPRQRSHPGTPSDRAQSHEQVRPTRPRTTPVHEAHDGQQFDQPGRLVDR
jgi:hypothetical protein